MNNQHRWTPVLDGDTYCSPACGFKCTKASFDLATSNALKLATEMGEGWEPKVWENGKWYYCVQRGKAAIHPPSPGGRYTCFFNAATQFIGAADDPHAALQDAMQQAQFFMDDLLQDILEMQR